MPAWLEVALRFPAAFKGLLHIVAFTRYLSTYILLMRMHERIAHCSFDCAPVENVVYTVRVLVHSLSGTRILRHPYTVHDYDRSTRFRTSTRTCAKTYNLVRKQ
eukprot:scaffold162860_cov47-Prasinocladus_malaysianus.AAC.1